MSEAKIPDRLTGTSRDPLPPGAALESAWIGGLASVLYVLLGREAFHGLDVHQFTASLARGHYGHGNHLLYLWFAGPIATTLHELLGLGLALCHL